MQTCLFTSQGFSLFFVFFCEYFRDFSLKIEAPLGFPNGDMFN
jgi:hypothetical protein